MKNLLLAAITFGMMSCAEGGSGRTHHDSSTVTTAPAAGSGTTGDSTQSNTGGNVNNGGTNMNSGNNLGGDTAATGSGQRR